MASSVIINPSWASLSLQNGWENYATVFGGNWATAEYRKIDNTVEIRGLVTLNSTPASGVTIATLPSGFRPNKVLIKAMPASAGDGMMRVDITDAGAISFQYALSGSSGNILFLDLQTVFGA